MFLSLNQYCNFKNITLLLIVFACCLNFSQGLVVEAVTNSYEVIEFQTKNAIEELVKYLVLWAFRLAGLFAFIMIIYAGFQYLTAGGNVEQQKEAQERIINTFIGIVLLFSFWLILNTINPNLLKTTPEPKPTTVKPPIETEQLPVIVGDFVLIGANSVILEGVSIGNGAVIAAGSVVTHNVPPNTVYGGSPAKFIKNVDEQTKRKTEILKDLRF